MLVQSIIQIMIIYQILPSKCGMPLEMVTSYLIPSAAATITIGNIFFAAQGVALGKKEGRSDVTALPEGINTVLVFAYALSIMAPEYQLTKDPVKAWEVSKMYSQRYHANIVTTRIIEGWNFCCNYDWNSSNSSFTICKIYEIEYS